MKPASIVKDGTINVKAYVHRICGYEVAPHVIEPAYPGALGHYINLGDCYDRGQLRFHAKELIDLKRQHQNSYARAYQCLRAAQEVRRNGEKGCLTEVVGQTIKKRAKGILTRELKRKKGAKGTIRRRFLSAITYQGIYTCQKSLLSQCRRIYEIQEHSGLSYAFLAELEAGIVTAGYDVISFLSPEEPKCLSQLMVPELSLAFLTTDGIGLEKRPYRRVRMETVANKEQVKDNRSQLRFSHRIAKELQRDGIRELAVAKKIHDEMEALVHPYVDFQGVDSIIEVLIAEIRALP